MDKVMGRILAAGTEGLTVSGGAASAGRCGGGAVGGSPGGGVGHASVHRADVGRCPAAAAGTTDFTLRGRAARGAWVDLEAQQREAILGWERLFWHVAAVITPRCGCPETTGLWDLPPLYVRSQAGAFLRSQRGRKLR